MRKFYLLFAILFQFAVGHAQTPKLIFGNTSNLSVLNYDPAIEIIQHNSGNTYHDFDLNTDGLTDIRFNIERKLSSQYQAAFITYPNAAAEVALRSADSLTVIAFKTGDSLVVEDYSFDFNEDAFDGGLLYVSMGPDTYGQFSLNSFRYMGFRILSTSDTLYGWLRLAKSSGSGLDSLSYIVDQLAFEGEISDISPLNQAGNFNVYPTITQHEIFIENNSALKSEASVYSLSGRLLLQQELSLNKNVMELDDFMDGIYLLVITSEKERRTFKISKQ